MALVRHHVGVAMYFYFNAVEADVHVVFAFYAAFWIFCVEVFDDFACALVVVEADVQVDVSAHSAFGLSVVLCSALAFEEDGVDAFGVKRVDDLVQRGVEDVMHL